MSIKWLNLLFQRLYTILPTLAKWYKYTNFNTLNHIANVGKMIKQPQFKWTGRFTNIGQMTKRTDYNELNILLTPIRCSNTVRIMLCESEQNKKEA